MDILESRMRELTVEAERHGAQLGLLAGRRASERALAPRTEQIPA